MKFAPRCLTAVIAGALLFAQNAGVAQTSSPAKAPNASEPAAAQGSVPQNLSLNLQQAEQTKTLPSTERAKGLGEPTFWKTWSAHSVEPLNLRNSERLRSLIVNGTLYLSLHDV